MIQNIIKFRHESKFVNVKFYSEDIIVKPKLIINHDSQKLIKQLKHYGYEENKISVKSTTSSNEVKQLIKDIDKCMYESTTEIDESEEKYRNPIFIRDKETQLLKMCIDDTPQQHNDITYEDLLAGVAEYDDF
jgi:hypothetical protein